jgi:hypothetical protein
MGEAPLAPPPARLPPILQTARRRIALFILALPLLLALPLHYWAFHVAGDWFVSTDIDPRYRRIHVGQMYLLLMAAVIGASVFPALLLLFIDKYRRVLTGLLLVPAAFAFGIALLILATFFVSLWNFG